MDTGVLNNRLFRADLDRALDLEAAGEPLPVRLWAALVAYHAEIATFPCCELSDRNGGGWGVATEVVPDAALVSGTHPQQVAYLTPCHIADKAHRWTRRLGADRMRSLVALIADESERQLAWNYLHGIYRSDMEGEPTAAEVITRAVRQIGRSVPKVVLPEKPNALRLIGEEQTVATLANVDGFMGGES